MQIGGWKLEPVDIHNQRLYFDYKDGDSPLPRSADRTRLTYLTEIDFKGDVPGFVIQQATKESASMVPKLRQIVKEIGFLEEDGCL